MSASATVRVGCFHRSLPMLAAQQHGFFGDVGIEVEYHQVTSSTQQFEQLREGRYDIVQTSPDNTANYRYNDGNPIGERIDGRGFMRMDHGMRLVLVARPGIGSVRELRGRTVAVDAPTSGYAYVLYEILARAGLGRDDYSVVATGGVGNRYRALMDGAEFDATLLSGGFETRASSAGFVLLGSVDDVVRPYLGLWGAATASWLEGNRSTAAALVSAYRSATRWCLDPGNRERCVELLMRLPDTSRELAEQLYDVYLHANAGEVPDVGIDREALRNVLRLRERYGGFDEDVVLDAAAMVHDLVDHGVSATGGA